HRRAGGREGLHGRPCPPRRGMAAPQSGDGMKYLTGVTNDRDEPALIRHGVGLLIQPGNSYHLRVGRYPYWAADNGCFNPDTYIGDDAWLDWLDRLPRERCLFVVMPDVARRPDGSLGGDPVATWEKFKELAPVARDMGFPV